MVTAEVAIAVPMKLVTTAAGTWVTYIMDCVD